MSGCSECVPGCTCGFGGEHLDNNPRCAANSRVVTAEAAGAVPDDVIELLARALHEAEWGPGGFDADLDADQFREEAHSLASVPSVAEVFARDAKVREIVAAPEPNDLTKWVPAALSRYEFIAALYSEDGTR